MGPACTPSSLPTELAPGPAPPQPSEARSCQRFRLWNKANITPAGSDTCLGSRSGRSGTRVPANFFQDPTLSLDHLPGICSWSYWDLRVGGGQRSWGRDSALAEPFGLVTWEDFLTCDLTGVCKGHQHLVKRQISCFCSDGREGDPQAPEFLSPYRV